MQVSSNLKAADIKHSANFVYISMIVIVMMIMMIVIGDNS